MGDTVDLRIEGDPPRGAPSVDAIVTGAGFRPVRRRGDEHPTGAVRVLSLPDTVGPNMRILVCGLNPSRYAAEHGVGFARRSNRFWKAAIAAGLVERERDPLDALHAHGVGMTDLVKRATVASAELSAREYAAGVERVESLVRWLRPGVVMFVGLEGWRSAIDRTAFAGRQPQAFGGRPGYLVPSTSGLNAHTRVDDLVRHFEIVRDLSAEAET